MRIILLSFLLFSNACQSEARELKTLQKRTVSPRLERKLKKHRRSRQLGKGKGGGLFGFAAVQGTESNDQNIVNANGFTIVDASGFSSVNLNSSKGKLRNENLNLKGCKFSSENSDLLILESNAYCLPSITQSIVMEKEKVVTSAAFCRLSRFVSSLTTNYPAILL